MIDFVYQLHIEGKKVRKNFIFLTQGARKSESTRDPCDRTSFSFVSLEPLLQAYSERKVVEKGEKQK